MGMASYNVGLARQVLYGSQPKGGPEAPGPIGRGLSHEKKAGKMKGNPAPKEEDEGSCPSGRATPHPCHGCYLLLPAIVKGRAGDNMGSANPAMGSKQHPTTPIRLIASDVWHMF
jgi:hypothetical protein